MTDYYALLKIRRDATKGEIKTAYRRLARKLHPDVNPAPDAAARFSELAKAYEVLSDDDKRYAYDNPAPDDSGAARGFSSAFMQDMADRMAGSNAGFAPPPPPPPPQNNFTGNYSPPQTDFDSDFARATDEFNRKFAQTTADFDSRFAQVTADFNSLFMGSATDSSRLLTGSKPEFDDAFADYMAEFASKF